MWKFDFRLLSIKLIKLYVLKMTETQEYSMILRLNSKSDFATMIRYDNYLIMIVD